MVINGIRWATRNVDKPGTFAAKPEDPGMCYQWNSKRGWSATDPLRSSDGTSKWDSNWNGNNATTWQAGNDPCPAGWRVPTEKELETLAETVNIWTTINGVKGKTVGRGTNQLFLPAAGFRDSNGSLHAQSSDGYYWSSTEYRSTYAVAWGFSFNYAYYFNKPYCTYVRCVSR